MGKAAVRTQRRSGSGYDTVGSDTSEQCALHVKQLEMLHGIVAVRWHMGPGMYVQAL